MSLRSFTASLLFLGIPLALAGCGDNATTDAMVNADMAVAAADLAHVADQAVAPDLSTPPDLTAPPDFAAPPPDLVMQADLVAPADLTQLPDLAPLSVLPVFTDDYAPGITFNPFGGSNNMVTVSMADKHSGTSSLSIVVPAGGYTGGALKAAMPVNLSTYNAVTFWAKADKARTFDKFGLGNNAATTVYQAEWNAVALTNAWTKYILPIPLPSRLGAETGLFHFAQGGNGPYTIYLDDIQYETVPNNVLGAPQPAIATETINKSVGDTFDVNGSSVTFAVNGVNETLSIGRAYLGWTSSMPMAASIDANGHVIALAVGTTMLTAKLGNVAANGVTTFNVAAAMAPAAAPPRPTLAQNMVISLLSDAYVNVPVDTWLTGWSQASEMDVMIGMDHVKKYTGLNFAGIETINGGEVDATAMSFLHIDIWTPDATVFKIKLVDFGATGKFGAPDQSEFEVVYDGNVNPKPQQGAWVSYDIPLTAFTGLKARAHLSQYILSGSTSTLFVDNVYFHK